ncbi:MAG: sulfite exporter TauE/SafE family protein [Candidatus Zixiibacteriota bacterium]
MLSLETAQLLALGLLAGVFGGALGLGGGFLLVPVFHTVFGWPLIQSVAVSQCCILASSLSATRQYLVRDLVDLRLGVLMGSTTIIGAAVGAAVAARLPGGLLLILFTLITLYAGIRMWRRAAAQRNDQEAVTRHRSRMGIAVSYSGLVGFAAATLGIGGGVLQVPIMHTYLGESIRRATATSAFIIGLTASTSAAIYYRQDVLVLEKAVIVALGVLVGAYIGAANQHRIPTVALRRAMAVVLFAVTLRMALRIFGW